MYEDLIRPFHDLIKSNPNALTVVQDSVRGWHRDYQEQCNAKKQRALVFLRSEYQKDGVTDAEQRGWLNEDNIKPPRITYAKRDNSSPTKFKTVCYPFQYPTVPLPLECYREAPYSIHERYVIVTTLHDLLYGAIINIWPESPFLPQRTNESWGAINTNFPEHTRHIIESIAIGVMGNLTATCKPNESRDNKPQPESNFPEPISGNKSEAEFRIKNEEVFFNGNLLNFSSGKMFDMFRLLHDKRPEVVPFHELDDKEFPVYNANDSLRGYICGINKALKETPFKAENKRGKGYQLIPRS